MPSNKDDKDIEIIPPGESHRRDRDEWVYVSFEDGTKAFRDLPLHKRILFAAAWLGGILIVGTILFLIVASAVLIWIPLLLAMAAITAIVVFFRTKFRR